MALVDPNIALSYKPLQVADPVAQYGRMATIENAEAQNRLYQLQMQQAQRQQETQNALNTAYQSAYDPTTGQLNMNQLRQSLATGGYGAQIPSVEKAYFAGRKEQVEFETKQRDLQSAKLDAAMKEISAFRDAPSAIQGVRSHLQRGNLDQTTAAALIDKIQTAPNFATWQQDTLRSLLSAKDRLGVLGTVDTGPYQVQTMRDPITGKVVVTDRFMKGMSPGESERIRLETEQKGINERRLELAEQQAARAADPIYQETMAAARTRGTETAKSDVKALEVLPKLVATATDGITLIDELIGKRDAKGNLLKGAAPHPGFEAAVGATLLPGARFVPGTAAASFDARFQQINSQSFLSAFESLRGGGHISNVEGEKATSAVNRMALAQEEKEFIAAARDVQDVLRKGVERAQARVGKIKASSVSAPSVGAVVDGYKFKGGNPADPASWEKQ